MRWPTAVFLAALLSVPLVAGEADPGAREPDLATDGGSVTDLAVAGDGKVLAGTVDIGSEVPPPGQTEGSPDETTWYVWDAEGDHLFHGSADLANCDLRLLDVCTTSVVAVTFDAGGHRYAIAANVASTPEDPEGTRAVVYMGTTAGGIVQTELFDAPIFDIAFDDLGASLGVAMSVPPAAGSTASTTRVDVLRGFSGIKVESGLARLATPFEIQAPIRSFAMAGTGEHMVVGADHHYRLVLGASAPSVGTTGTAAAVAVATATPFTSISGGTDGMVAFYSGTATTGVSLTTPRFTQQPAKAITSVAISKAGTFAAAGDEEGKLIVYNLAAPGTYATRLPILDIGGRVAFVRFSQDGMVLLASDGATVRMYSVQGTGLVPMWVDDFAGATKGDVSFDGATAAVASGTAVRVYESKYEVVMRVPGILPSAVPKTSREVAVTFDNTGNRRADVELDIGFPKGWFLTAEPRTFALDPGANQTVTVRFVVPEVEASGPFRLWLNQTLKGVPGFPAGLTSPNFLEVEVPSIERLVLLDDGPMSLGVASGSTVSFQLLVVNGGNQPQGSRLLGTATPGWTATIDPQSVNLQPREERGVVVFVQAPAGQPPGTTGRITVSLERDPSQVVHLQATIGAFFRPTLEGPTGVVVEAGNTTSFRLTVTNRGNAPDSISVQVTNRELPDGWEVNFSGQGTAEVDLGMGAAAEVVVSVQAAEGSPDGGVLLLEFVAKSLGDATKTAEEAVTVTVESEFEPKEPGGKGSPGIGAGAILLVIVVAIVLVMAILGGRRMR